MKALGIDPGTSSFDVCCIENCKVVFQESIPTSVVAKHPASLFQVIVEAEPDVMVGPSAMGVPCKHISQMSDLDIAYATLAKNTEVDIAIRKFIKMLQRASPSYNAYFIPSVIQLPTVPYYRKTNKVDMGTADKTCITALAIWDHAQRHNISYKDVNVIVVELGFGFNAAIAVENGKIIDGIGGTLFPGPGFLTIGAMDLELAHILGSFSENQLALGGVSYIASGSIISPETFARKNGNDKMVKVAWDVLVEGVIKAVAMEVAIFNMDIKEILISGRLTRVRPLYTSLINNLRSHFNYPVREIAGFTQDIKEAAQGAAIIANGLENGTYSEIVDVMKLKRARGTVLDYVRWPHFNGQTVMKRKIALMEN